MDTDSTGAVMCVAIYFLNSAFEQSVHWGIKHYSIGCFAHGFKTSRNRYRNTCNIKILCIKGAELSLFFLRTFKDIHNKNTK